MPYNEMCFITIYSDCKFNNYFLFIQYVVC